jgi:hypothetical protein
MHGTIGVSRSDSMSVNINKEFHGESRYLT